MSFFRLHDSRDAISDRLLVAVEAFDRDEDAGPLTGHAEFATIVNNNLSLQSSIYRLSSLGVVVALPNGGTEAVEISAQFP